MKADRFDSLDARATLARAAESVRARRLAEVDGLLLTLRWCDLHSVDPQTQPGAVPVGKGGDKLVRLGGDGTPEVADLCLAELAVARHAHVVAVRNEAADALDLRHRLPNLFAAVLALEVEPWVARKVAAMSRRLSKDAVGLVDLAVTEAVHEAPRRLLGIAEAKVIEADSAGYWAKVVADSAKTGVWVQQRKPGKLVDALSGDAGVSGLRVRMPDADVVDLDATLDDLADALAVTAEEDSELTRDQLRARALAVLADPPRAAALLSGATGGDEATDDAPAPAPAPPRPVRRVLHVHLHVDVLTGRVPGIGRVEELGPVLLEQVAALLGHRDVTLTPVVDLNTGASVNSYEHPAAVKQRTMLRTVYEAFPHSASRATRRLDHDHPTPYDNTGPPGQTGDHNDAPLTRYAHRVKTHDGYQVRQLAHGVYRWVTPHGLARLVSRTGTHEIEVLRAADRRVIGEVYRPAIDIELADYRTA